MNISIVQYPSAHPGRCAHCGNASAQDGRKFVDMGLQVPRYGAIYFCEHCVRELGRLFGLAPKAEITGVEQDLLNTEMLLEAARQENARLRNALDSLDFLGSSNPSGLADNPDQKPDDGPAPEPTPAKPKRASRSAKGAVAPDDGPSEPDSSTGSSDVPDNDLAAQLRAERRISF